MAVAVSWIVVGVSQGDNIRGLIAGAVFVHSRTSSLSFLWTQMTQLLVAYGALNDFFGMSVAFSHDASTIVVGAERNDDFSSSIASSGATNLNQANSMTTSTTTVEWMQIGKFVAEDQASNEFEGKSIAIENNIAVVGAPVDDSF